MFHLKSKIKKPNEKTPARSLYEKFEYKVKQSTALLIKADAQKTVGLCDALFDGDHMLFINQLKTQPVEEFTYLSCLLEVKHDIIKENVTNLVQMNSEQDATNKSIVILKRHLELAC